MKEDLLCYALLLNNGLMPSDKYNEYLNSAFLEKPDGSLLLELQFVSSDMRSTIRLIFEECYGNKINKDSFAKILLQELKTIYFKKSLPIEEFAKRAYTLWKDIPDSNISLEEPLNTLSYADDPLSWGDVKQTCEIFEDLFEYYNKQAN